MLSVAMSQMLPSMVTLFPVAIKPDPVIVIRVPPPVPPLAGLVEVIEGVKATS